LKNLPPGEHRLTTGPIRYYFNDPELRNLEAGCPAGSGCETVAELNNLPLGAARPAPARQAQEMNQAGPATKAPCPILAVILSERSESKDLLLAFLSQGWETNTLNQPCSSRVPVANASVLAKAAKASPPPCRGTRRVFIPPHLHRNNHLQLLPSVHT
jgi:hypothetical protein